jgi:hypothetical protein
MPRPVVICLTERDADVAREWADKVLGTQTMTRPNYTGLHAPHRFLLGYLGELACAAWLRNLDAEFTHSVRTDGRPGEPEFSVLGRRGRFTLDPKFGNGVRARRFMFPESQYQQPDVYVGGRVLDIESRTPTAEIHGWITRAEAKALPVGDFGYGVPTRWCLLSDLHDMMEIGK